MILGIETSCDETALCLLGMDKTIHHQSVFSQLKEHSAYGGVVPEIAARAHLHYLPHMLEQLWRDSGHSIDSVTHIAATAGPGLIGGLVVGHMFGQALAAAAHKEFYSINHLEGHALVPRLSADIPFPYLILLVSGGHTQLLCAHAVGQYDLLGTTQDDALGECFDKTAKLLGLGWPGGPLIERLAMGATNPARFVLPRPLLGRDNCDFSFSGLKTAARKIIQTPLAPTDYPDFCAAFQTAIGDVLADRCRRALDKTQAKHLVVAGGVAANQYLRQRLHAMCTTQHITLHAPPIAHCTDNAVMIAYAAWERIQAGIAPTTIKPRPRWPLAELNNMLVQTS